MIHPDTLIGAIVLLILFVVLGKVLSFIVERSIRIMLDRDLDQRIDRLAASFLNQFARVFVWIFVLMLYAHTVPALDRLGTALLASVSIASVVIGLAAQSTLANFVAVISLILYKPFRMGDRQQLMAPSVPIQAWRPKSNMICSKPSKSGSTKRVSKFPSPIRM